MLQALIYGAVVVGGTSVPVWLLAGTAAGVATLAPLATLWALWPFALRGRYLSWGYCEREEDLIVRRGMLVRRVSVVPYGRMQIVDLTAGPIDRFFGLATVKLHTAAAASDARVPGLPRGEAAALRDRLASRGEAQATGI